MTEMTLGLYMQLVMILRREESQRGLELDILGMFMDRTSVVNVDVQLLDSKQQVVLKVLKH